LPFPLIGAGTTDGHPSVVRNLGRNGCVDTVRGPAECRRRRRAFASASGQRDWPVKAWPTGHGLCNQLLAGLDGAPASGLAGGRQLAPGALGERLDAHHLQQVIGDTQLLARVEAAAPAAQPLPP
jgi:hypothetical protein